MLAKFKLYANTLKYLKLSQLYWQLRYRLYRNKNAALPKEIAINPVLNKDLYWLNKTASLDKTSISFLNKAKAYQLPQLWSDQSEDALWFFNVHYFDYLNNAEVACNLKKQLVDDWISNVAIDSLGWHAYPTSLRMVNWIKWIVANNITDENILKSLYRQAIHLNNNLEKDILANHLFANIKAMLIASLFFNTKQANHWQKKYEKLLVKELKQQILPGGAHFELSPMYHHIILEDMLDVVHFYQLLQQFVPEQFNQIIKKMLHWSQAMTHTDGEVSYFNDSVVGIAASYADLQSYAAALNMSENEIEKVIGEYDGFYVVKQKPWDLKFDVAEVGASFQPGHVHADALSFELSCGEQRFFVNSGVSTYHDIEKRKFQRSTKSHSTVTINNKSSSQVWSKFRVANRSRIVDKNLKINGDEVVLVGAHNGYAPAIHCREITVGSAKVSIKDQINHCRKAKMAIYFYLHPNVKVKQEAGYILLLDDKITLKVKASNPITIANAKYFESFNVERDNQVLIVSTNPKDSFENRLTIEMV